MHSTQLRSRFLPAGFTLIELMIGMALGLLSVLIIVQVMSLFEAQRRTTTGSADAQTNGGIALYSIARDAQLAGYALLPITDSALECTAVTNNVAGITGIAPAVITNGVATGSVPASDTITIRYGSSQTGGAVAQITSMNGTAAVVGSNLGCQVNDVVLTSSGINCALSKATAVGTGPSSITPSDPAFVAPLANMACLGNWNEITYYVDPATGNLYRKSVVNGVTISDAPSVVGVVNLQAQYGISAAANSNQVIQWVSATAGGTWDPATMTVPNRNRIKAIRIAVVARNAKIEPAAVTSACSSTATAAPTGLCAWDATSALPNPIVGPFVASPAPAIDLSPGNPDWARYRYRVFETIIPLRNVIWSKGTL